MVFPAKNFPIAKSFHKKGRMDLQKLQLPLETQLALLGFELVCLESVREGRDSILRLYIDHLDGATSNRKITLDDCVAANDGLVIWMDAEFPSLRETVNLEISSPGMERPLTKQAHYQRFAGRLCRIQARMPLNGQKRFKGWIGECAPDSVTIEEDGVLKTVPFEIIQKSRLAPFDEASTPQPKHVVALRSNIPDVHAEPGAETSADLSVGTNAGAEE